VVAPAAVLGKLGELLAAAPVARVEESWASSAAQE
jgi:hypothetical protein